MNFPAMSMLLKFGDFLFDLGQIDVCIGFFIKFYREKGLFGPLGDVSTSSKRPPNVRAVHFYI